jgi:hypothetical protein
MISTLLTTYSAIENGFYLEEIHTEVNTEDFFVE